MLTLLHVTNAVSKCRFGTEMVVVFSFVTMTKRSRSVDSSSSPSASYIWDVQEILAERTTSSGEHELLVVWKASWIPKHNMIADGPVMRRFEATPKVIFRNSVVRDMRIILPVEPGTVLDDDSAEIEYRETASRKKRSHRQDAKDRRDEPVPES